MPKARQRSSTGLSIELEDSPKYFTVGDKVSGDVVLNTADDFAIGSVSLEFYGRVKVHFIQSHGHGESHWRGRAPLFSDLVLLYEGFHTHKPGSFRWPFTFEIPIHPDNTAIKHSKHQWKEKRPFLSTEDYIPAHPMPPTFDFRKRGFGFRYHVFVEYVLKVEVKQAEGSRVLLPPSCRRTTLPVLVKDVSKEDLQVYSLPLSAQFSLQDHSLERNRSSNSQTCQPELQSQIFTQTVRASRLMNQTTPGVAMIRRSSSSLLEKTRRVFNSNSLPRYTFEMTVSMPKTIHLLQQDAIPFVVGVSTINDAESTTILSEHYPDVRIDNVSVYLTAITRLRCKGPFPPRPTEYDIQLLERQPVEHTITMKPETNMNNSGISSRCHTGGKARQDHVEVHNQIDISRLPGLSIAVIAAKIGKQTEKPLTPSFSTYIIAREYKLKWRLELDVAGEKIKIRNQNDIPVKVLPPKTEDLNAIMMEGDVTTAVDHGDDEEGSEQNEKPAPTSLGNLVKLQKQKGKKPKHEEAEEDRQATATSSSQQPLQYRQDEMLPRYEQGPIDFGYRNEIDDGPPQYGKE